MPRNISTFIRLARAIIYCFVSRVARMKNLQKQTATGPYRMVREDPRTLGHLHAMNHECPPCCFSEYTPFLCASGQVYSLLKFFSQQAVVSRKLLCPPSLHAQWRQIVSIKRLNLVASSAGQDE